LILGTIKTEIFRQKFVKKAFWYVQQFIGELSTNAKTAFGATLNR